jgi:hypothetical protein
MSLVKDSSVIKKALLIRLKELYPSNVGFGFRNASIINDAKERGFKIAPEQLSRYFSNSPKNALSEVQIVWLCIRYGINLKLEVTSSKFEEVEALNKLKVIFG